MKSNFISINLYILLFSLIIISSCKKPEDDHNHDENEFITTVKLVVMNSSDSTDIQTTVWKQTNPDGTTPPDTSLARLNLKTNSTYSLSAYFLNESKSPAEDLTSEIQAEAKSHGVFYIPDAVLSTSLTIVRNDVDANNLPLGLKATLTTGSASVNAFMNVILRHQPTGKDGTITPGTTDADTKFRVEIKP
jgi:hypothetical protein